MKSRTLTVRIALALAVAVMMCVVPAAQKGKTVGAPTPIRVDGQIIKSYIAWLAAPEREGRRTLTPGYEKSVEWAAAKFKDVYPERLVLWGVQPELITLSLDLSPRLASKVDLLADTLAEELRAWGHYIVPIT